MGCYVREWNIPERTICTFYYRHGSKGAKMYFWMIWSNVDEFPQVPWFDRWPEPFFLQHTGFEYIILSALFMAGDCNSTAGTVSDNI